MSLHCNGTIQQRLVLRAKSPTWPDEQQFQFQVFRNHARWEVHRTKGKYGPHFKCLIFLRKDIEKYVSIACNQNHTHANHCGLIDLASYIFYVFTISAWAFNTYHFVSFRCCRKFSIACNAPPSHDHERDEQHLNYWAFALLNHQRQTAQTLDELVSAREIRKTLFCLRRKHFKRFNSITIIFKTRMRYTSIFRMRELWFKMQFETTNWLKARLEFLREQKNLQATSSSSPIKMTWINLQWIQKESKE